MRSWYVGLIVALTGMVLAGCAGQAGSSAVDVDSSETSASTVLDTSYADALDVSGQLALGTMRLEQTEHAIAPEQATALLPLWQAIRGGTLQGDAEINAVISQIEGEMTPEQLEAIVAMQLTPEDLQSWAQEQGLSVGSGSGSGELGGGKNLSEEERAERLAQLDITEGDLPPDRGQLSDEERAALRATAEASGMSVGSGTGANSGQLTIVLNPLVEMLTERAGGADGPAHLLLQPPTSLLNCHGERAI